MKQYLRQEPTKYKIHFYNASDVLSIVMFGSNHSITWNNEYLEVSRKIGHETRTVYKVRIDRVQRIYRYDSLIYDQGIGIVGGNNAAVKC